MSAPTWKMIQLAAERAAYEFDPTGAPVNAIREAERNVHAEVEETVAFIAQKQGKQDELRTLQKRTA